MINVKLCSQRPSFGTKFNTYDGAYFTLVKPYFKSVLNSIELPLGSIFNTTHPFVIKLTNLKTSGEVIHCFKYYGQTFYQE